MRDPEWTRDIDAMCLESAAELRASLDESEVCSDARAEIVAKLLIAHTDVLDGTASLEDILARARSLMLRRSQGAH